MPMPSSLWSEAAAAARVDAFLPVASAIFLCAVTHAFLTPVLMRASGRHSGRRAALLHLLGEVELVFALWAGVLFVALVLWPTKGWLFACRYLLSGDYALAGAGGPVSSDKFLEPLFVFVIMALASAQAVIVLAGRVLGGVARVFGGTPAARWFVTLTLAPLLGSLITEPAAMTIAALLLSAQFYVLQPSERLKYATLALLFVNISVGGALTHFAAPPVVMVAAKWGWGLGDVFRQFGLASLATVIAANTLYFLVFRIELQSLRGPEEGRGGLAPVEIPLWVTVGHLLLMFWTVLTLGWHRADLMALGFVAFLGFIVATGRWQTPLRLRGPLLVGFFLAGLVLLGGVQGWWIGPLLVRLSEGALLVASVVLTSFNDNAAITYLASQVPALAAPGAVAEALRHAVMAGALAGGGLTVIANAPNPAGQSILAPHFPDGISPGRLALWATPPTLIAVACYLCLR